ncbi:MAG: hypothetical protein R3195_10925, partial [Gemmatimonadota bacterium]|nr:hypothetical protein [Gemmatimonadota bacterium]
RPVTELARRHASEGLEIDEWTATPRWLGDRFDVDWGLFVLRQPSPVDVREDGVSAETRPGSTSEPETPGRSGGERDPPPR